MMEELRKFTTMDNHEAVKVGDLEKTRWVKPDFTSDFPEAAVREGADELTLRVDEGMFRHHECGCGGWLRRLVG